MSPRSKSQRQALQDWIRDKINAERFSGVRWVDKKQGVFQIPWVNQKTQEWTKEYSEIFLEYARHTGKLTAGGKFDFPKYKQNFKSAVNKNRFIKRLTDSEKKGFRVYMFRSDIVLKRKRKVTTAELDKDVLQQDLVPDLSDQRETSDILSTLVSNTLGLSPMTGTSICQVSGGENSTSVPDGKGQLPDWDLLQGDSTDQLLRNLATSAPASPTEVCQVPESFTLFDEQVSQNMKKLSFQDQSQANGGFQGPSCIQNTTVDSTTENHNQETGYFSDLNVTGLSLGSIHTEENMSLDDMLHISDLVLDLPSDNFDFSQGSVHLGSSSANSAVTSQTDQPVLLAVPERQSPESLSSMETTDGATSLEFQGNPPQNSVKVTNTSSIRINQPGASTSIRNTSNSVPNMDTTGRGKGSVAEHQTPRTATSSQPSQTPRTATSSQPSQAVMGQAASSATSDVGNESKMHVQIIYGTAKTGKKVVKQEYIKADSFRLYFGDVDCKRIQQQIQQRDKAVQVQLPSVDSVCDFDEDSKKKILEVLERFQLGVVITYRDEDIFVVRRCQPHVYLFDGASKSDSLPRSSIKKKDIETKAFDFKRRFKESIEKHKKKEGPVERDHFLLSLGYDVLLNDDSPTRLVPIYVVVKHMKAVHMRVQELGPEAFNPSPMNSDTGSFDNVVQFAGVRKP